MVKKYRNIKTNITVIFLIAVILLQLICPLFVFASDSPNRTVKVGYFYFPGYHEMVDGEYGSQGSGYGYDFLQLLRRYTNLNYQYVGYENSWQEMQEMLRNGQIDMVTSARKTSQREKEFAFSNPIGTSYAELSVRLEDNRYQVNGYDGFDGMTIGVLKGNSRNNDLELLAKEKGFAYHEVVYTDETELTDALHNGKVDGIVASSLRKHYREKVVARFALEEFYVIVRKEDTDLLDEINYGIEQMDLNEGDWRNRLFYQYTTANTENNLSFTQKEKAYIYDVRSGKKEITACAQPDRDPYSYTENGKMVGIIPEYFDYLMNMAGLPYTVMVAESRKQYYEWVENNITDIYMDMSSDRNTILEEEIGVSTDDYLQLTMSRVTQKDFQGSIHTVAVAYNQNYDGIDIDLAENVQTIPYDSRKEAMQAVKDGKADACYVYTYMAEKFVNQDPDGELMFHIVDKPAFGLSISISPTTDRELISILNKCLKADQSHILDELMEKYTGNEQGNVSLARFAKQNPWFVVALISICFGAAAVFALVARNNNNMRILAAERKEYEASLKKKNEQLEESIRKEQSANNAKTAFLNNMSHDIRTPMNAIIGFTNIALKQGIKPEVQGCLKKIEESSEHLLTLINDVLDISRIESGKITVNPIPVDITAITDVVLDITRGFLSSRDICFQVNRAKLNNPYVLADPIRIREVLVNILGNAVKFTDDGGTITFSTDYHPGMDDQHMVVRYQISDTGIGMSEEFLKNLFEEFAQENMGARTNYKGSGLGMAITKQYVDMMGGTIFVESEKGVGSTFTVELPLELTDEEVVQKQSIPVSGNDLMGVSVLLAEDNDLNAEIATVQLEEVGMKVTRARDGKQAVKLFGNSVIGSFDVILMDIMMPEMNGYEATKAIRSLSNRPDGRTIPIIALTANAFAEDVHASLDAGMNGHLSKPIVMDEVVKTIARNLDR